MAEGRFSIRHMPGFAPIAIACFVVLYAPLLVLMVYSVNAGRNIGIWEGFSWTWYQAAWNNADVQTVTLRSIQLAVVAMVLSTVMATMAALATTRTARFRGIGVIGMVIHQPLMVPEIVTGVALLIVFALIKLTTNYYGMGYLYVAHAAFCIPFAYMPIRARLENMDLTLETAAADLYATPWMAFRRVTLPQLWPGILAGAMLAFVISLDDVVITEFVKSGGQDTLPTYMLGQLRRVVSPELYAIATIFFLVSVLIVTLFFFVNRKDRD